MTKEKKGKKSSGTSYSGEKTATGLELTKGAVILSPGSTKKYKTGEWRTFKPEIDQTKCIKCAKCWLNCPDAAIFKDKDGKFQVNYDYCKGCLICAKECPVKCISYKVEEK
jgi:pyruvate ferredoxin oxidoreductase delta subunit